ncbi:hypothetical protein K7H22_09945 [Seohaeicola saemankumensis]|uniref:hypothetical protein n=1 Tax=Seohaeicola saemankumensis TaxID=481181 RepID=UPI001E332118|nr:hypothetical protein [Seohaeicola saemankumensis]MCD1626312.1 hypothetical protein [Seohaeicola saemankumensis]
MKAFFKAFGIVVCLTIAGMILATAAPQAGVWIGAVFLVVPLFALIKPLPKFHLGHRGFSISIAFFVGLLTTTASLGLISETEKMVSLRETDPTAYLAALESQDQTKWLAELEQLAPERYALEVSKIEEEEAARIAEDAIAEAARAAEREQAQVELRAKDAERRAVEQRTKLVEHIEQLDREIASIPGISASKYTDDVSNINVGLLLMGAWALLYEEGGKLDLNEEAQRKREQFRRLLVNKQSQMLPAMRDAYGPAMRQQLWEADGSARTIGAGYRTVEFVSAAFARNANIQQIHTEIRENLMMLRFTRAQYKWIKQASEFSYYTLEVPKDSDIVKWESGGRYRVLD